MTRKSRASKSTEAKKSEESESIAETVVEEPIPVPEPAKPKLKPAPKPVAKKMVKKYKVINMLTQKININILDGNNKEQHVEINAKSFVIWPFVKNLGGQVNTLKLKKMIKVHPIEEEE